MIEQKKLSYRDTVRYGSCVAIMVFGSGEGQITIKFSGELHPPAHRGGTLVGRFRTDKRASDFFGHSIWQALF